MPSSGNKGMTESATENWIMMSHIDDGDETLLSSYNMYLYAFFYFYAALHPAAKINDLRMKHLGLCRLTYIFG